MSRSFFLTSALSLSFAAVSSAASIIVSDFSGDAAGTSLSEVDGWGQSEPDSEVGAPLAWVSTLGGSPAASVGSYYNVPGGTSFYAYSPVGSSFTSSTLSLQFGLQDSTTEYAFRNDFGFSLVNAAGDSLFSISLTATSQDGLFDDPIDPTAPGTSDATWNLSVSSIGMASKPALVALGEDSIYSLYILFTVDGADINYQLYVQGGSGPTVTDSGTLTGLSSETIDQFRVNFSQGSGDDWGDNFLTFRAVPEPSAFLLGGLGGLALLRRRRR